MPVYRRWAPETTTHLCRAEAIRRSGLPRCTPKATYGTGRCTPMAVCSASLALRPTSTPCDPSLLFKNDGVSGFSIRLSSSVYNAYTLSDFINPHTQDKRMKNIRLNGDVFTQTLRRPFLLSPTRECLVADSGNRHQSIPPTVRGNA